MFLCNKQSSCALTAFSSAQALDSVGKHFQSPTCATNCCRRYQASPFYKSTGSARPCQAIRLPASGIRASTTAFSFPLLTQLVQLDCVRAHRCVCHLSCCNLTVLLPLELKLTTHNVPGDMSIFCCSMFQNVLSLRSSAFLLLGCLGPQS